MGREIRKVPVGWKHPKRKVKRPERTREGVKLVEMEDFIPLYETPCSEALREWEEEKRLWDSGEHETLKNYPETFEGEPFEAWGGPRPDTDRYFPDFEDPCDGWCVYETVSEGTPVTPVFETAEELIDYLVEHGDFWDQARRERGMNIPCDPWSRSYAESFVKERRWAPSLILSQNSEADNGDV